MRSPATIPPINILQASAQILAALIVLGCFVTTTSAQDESPKTIAVGTTISSSPWSAFVDLCETIAPYCGVICFLAPL
eukprot:CAMPEP_0202002738 /NCGR_PEP_ID=MMETSP0905-20130828/8511_1 /ASSEMBLY_ACC=CAM_ASM_000554 /TAXON_ID=420261 /ORGANISM="Thalassiosira antarctica, Strain CCMP982" /LENGTH=77 /DNA_ID=CAMNT_0048559731 /DNA_START=17 /DNA_END=247 /DNA_ORIENTATION=+